MRRYKRLVDIPYAETGASVTRVLRELARRGVPYKVKPIPGAHRISVYPGDFCFATSLVLALKSTGKEK